MVKATLMERISEAVRAADTKRIAVYGALAGKLEEDEQLLKALDERLAAYQDTLASPIDTPNLTWRSHPGKSLLGNGRETARHARRSLAERLEALGTSPPTLRGATLEIDGFRIAAPFATERRPGRWFLGISDELFDAVAILCLENAGPLRMFLIPEGELSPIQRRLSKSGHQVKVNIKKEDNNWYLLVPGEGAKDISEYESNFTNLLKGLSERGPCTDVEPSGGRP